jgi:hypothetical protein
MWNLKHFSGLPIICHVKIHWSILALRMDLLPISDFALATWKILVHSKQIKK